jgi:hypothetical protein
MNRTFPAMVLKIEHDSVMPRTSIPTGKNKKVTWEYLRNLSEVYARISELKKQPRVIRATLCVYVRQGRWLKVQTCTHNEPTWLFALNHDANKEERVARTAIIPAEVAREATRSAQS